MISLLCPTRGRPFLAKKLLSSALENAKLDIEILFYLNEDDPSLPEYLDIIDSKYLEIGKDRSPVFTWNKLADKSRGEICFLSADHVTFIEKNWDLLVYEKFEKYEDKVVFVYPSVKHLLDHTGQQYMTDDYCPFYFVHKNWINCLGYFAFPMYWHWFIDRYFHRVGNNLNRIEVIKTPIINAISYKTDITDKKKLFLQNRERDFYIFQNSQMIERYITADTNQLKKFIETY